MSTTIAWTDETWNPVTGCTKVSAGCDNCYAESLAERFRDTPGHYFANGFDLQLRPAKLVEPLHWKKPRRVFVNSMSDLFHDDVRDDYIARVWAVMALAPQHTFQVLTKRHGRMRSLLNSADFYGLVRAALHLLHDVPELEAFGTERFPLPNVWMGVSVEDQQWADIRVPALLDTPAAVRFLSCEPLLGPVDLAPHMPEVPYWDSREAEDWGIHWVIAGGESGRRARPMQAEWARSLRDQCADTGTAFFMKQAGTVLAKEWGARGKGEDPTEWPEPFPQEYPRGAE